MISFDNFPSSLDTEMDKILLQICTQIQITKTQHTLAETAYHSVGSFLSGSSCALSHCRPKIYPQGSFKIQTTNRPIRQEEFDLDFVCELKSRLASGATPDNLLFQLYDCTAIPTKSKTPPVAYPGCLFSEVVS